MKLLKFMPELERELEVQLEISTFRDDQIRIIMRALWSAEVVVLRKLLDEDQ